MESATIFVGVAFLLSIVTLKQNGAGAGSLGTAHALVALYNRIFLLGQSFMPAICDVLLGVMLYKSRLVPRRLSLIGIVGGPVLVIGYLAVLSDTIGQHGALAGLFALPVAVFEFSLGVWLIVKGFDPNAVAALESNNHAVVGNGRVSGGSWDRASSHARQGVGSEPLRTRHSAMPALVQDALDE